jgi:hypothetical protein
MKKPLLIAGLIVIFIALAIFTSQSTPLKKDDSMPKARIISGNGAACDIFIEISDDPEERMSGLMYRDRINDSSGMIFIFENEYPYSFWMKDTYIPLDMMFISENLYIVDINHNAIPGSTIPYQSRSACKYVIEVNGGFCESHGIKIGDKVELYLYQ